MAFYIANGRNKKNTVEHIQKIKGWRDFSRTCLIRWERTAKRRKGEKPCLPTGSGSTTREEEPKRGRRVNHGFERKVLHKVVYFVIDDTNNAAREAMKAKDRGVETRMGASTSYTYLVQRKPRECCAHLFSFPILQACT